MYTQNYTGSLLNQELHSVFQETTGESTKQSTLDYLQRHPRSDLDPLKTHTSFGSAQTPLRFLILTTSRTHNTSQLHTQSFFKVQKDYTCYRKIWNQYKMKILFHTLLIQETQSKLQLFKSKISQKLKYVFLWFNLCSCLLQKSEKTIYCFQRLVKAFKTRA